MREQPKLFCVFFFCRDHVLAIPKQIVFQSSSRSRVSSMYISEADRESGHKPPSVTVS